ncbi:hypothetical protein CAPTEDRAFT_198861 [Capitella teleta]|uniref:Fibrinogen C-terminal domain-containing protein n=1 Tax=Capitella teleta TaxID=283909 RepID=R7T7T7_CAPTE|nr:hypothetical protein CAPTEDRAFT_198861 [Capitella teleta]|eukprot:ELT87485.1 hypothetical protein CAPTEDRAFT_198861 [Capitella teleta]
MPPPTNCKELLKRGETKSGVYTIYPEMLPDATPMKVFCDMETEGGGWLVFQRRNDGSENFTLGWNQYSGGFGDLNGEFWLGNRNLNKLTAGQSNELRVDMMDGEGEKRFAKYKTFEVGPELEKFPLTVGGYSGDAGDSLFGHNGHTFSTIDQDNDAYFGDCAAQYKGGWWYSACHGASLNGPYLNGPHTSYADGIEWNTWKGYYYSLQFTEMKIRPLC